MDRAAFWRPADQPTDDHRGDRQQHQRYRHRRWGFVWMNIVWVEPRLAGEHEEDEPEHVERREEGRYQPDDGQDLPDRDRDLIRDPGSQDDLVLRPESGEGDHARVGE